MHAPDLAQDALNRSLPVPARLGALQALAALASGHGRSLASVAPESLALGAKHAARFVVHPMLCPLSASHQSTILLPHRNITL